MRLFLRELLFLLEFLLVWPFVALIRRLSQSNARAMALGLGRAAYRILSFDRRWALRNLELVFGPNLTPAQRSRIARQSFEHIALTRMEGFRWSHEWMLANVIEEGGDAARATGNRLRDQGKGCIVITAHLGNFELLPPWVYHTGFRGPVVYRPQDNWRVEQLIAGERLRYLGGQTVPRGPFATLNLMYALREGKGVGLLIDMNTLADPVFVNFLGFPASSPKGVAALSLAVGVPVIPCVAVRRKDGRNRLIYLPAIEPESTGDRRADIARLTQRHFDALEPYILAYPEQYNWPHPRWRLRPDGSFWTLDQGASHQSAERIGEPRRVGTPL